MSIHDIVVTLPALTALIAVIVGPALQWRIARRQAADNVSAKRQNWIDELRKDSAAFLQTVARLEELRRPNPAAGAAAQEKTFDERAEANAKANELKFRILLRLNPDESDHNTLLELFNGLASVCKDPSPGESQTDREAAVVAFHEQTKRIIKHLQLILKKEWERIKTGN